MEKEFQTRAETTANAMELMNNSIYRTKVAIGQGLLPAIVPVASVVADAATAVGNFATEYPNLTGAVLVEPVLYLVWPLLHPHLCGHLTVRVLPCSVQKQLLELPVRPLANTTY